MFTSTNNKYLSSTYKRQKILKAKTLDNVFLNYNTHLKRLNKLIIMQYGYVLSFSVCLHLPVVVLIPNTISR